jgi:hypothetical protein
MIVWDPIAPGETLPRGINWAPRFSAGTTDTIQSSNWSPSSPAGLTITKQSPDIVGLVTLVMISTPALNQLYTFTNTITMASGAIEVETVQITCAIK